MTTIVTRTGKGSPLTHVEVDTNFTNLNTNKLETAAIPLGTAAAPSVSFLSDANTGIYSPGADQLAVATNGTQRLTVDTAATTSTLPVVHPLGAVGTPSITFTGDLNTGFYSPAADTLAAVTAGSNRLHITSGGLVGIGTSSPTAKLTIAAATGPGIQDLLSLATADVGGADNGARIGLKYLGGVTCAEHILAFTNLSTTVNTYQAFLTTGADGTLERMRITSAGYIGIGTTSPAYQLQVSTDSAGKPSSALWTIVSDERIKEDIELADLDLCYEAIKAIPLKRYKWRDDIYTAEQVTDRRKLGWIAQDVEAIFPKAVGTHEFKYNQIFEETIIPAVEEELDDEGNVITPAQPERIEQGDLISEDVIEDCRDLNSDQLYAAMYGAIQKLMAKVETLEAEVEALKAA